MEQLEHTRTVPPDESKTPGSLSPRRATMRGHGSAFGSFGEIIQGRLSNGEDILVTLPVNLWSSCELVCTRTSGPLVVDCDLAKSRALLSLLLNELGVHSGLHIRCSITSDIPIGKGLSSSTADMLAIMRAMQQLFGCLFTPAFISRAFSAVEPHDALHYGASAAYNHRRGRLIRDFGYIPSFTIVAVDGGGEVDTIEYNRTVSFSSSQLVEYDRLLGRLESAFEARSDASIARCATDSAAMHARARGSALLNRALALAERISCLGLIATHSGTCAGFLLPGDACHERLSEVTDCARRQLDQKTFVTHTLRLL